MADAWVPAPQYPNYASFLENMIGGLPQTYRQAQQDENALAQQKMQLEQQRRQQGIEQAFPNGLPMANGQPDYAAIMQTVAQKGGLGAALGLAPQALQQKQMQDAQNGSSLLQAQPQASAPQSIPPASAAAGVSARRPDQPAQGAASGQSVNALVSSSLPSGTPQEQTVATNIAKAMKVNPDAPLSEAQEAQARKYMASYAQRKNIQPTAPQGGALPIFAAAGAQYGISPDFLARTAQIESGGNPNAKNASGAAGLFQFIPSTAKKYGLTNPNDPVAATDAAARLAADNKASLTKSLGREPTDAELYLAHQQGAGGAAKLLRNPDAKASDVVGMKAVIQNGGRPDMTAGQFAKMWTDKYGSGGAELGSSMAMRQPMGQGAVMPASVSGASSGAPFPQIMPQQPGAQEFQAMAPVGGVAGLRAASGMTPISSPAQGGAQAAPAPAMPAQEQPTPLVQPVPLPRGFTDPQRAILAIDQEIAKLSGNPYAKGQVAALEDWRDRLAEQLKPIAVHPGVPLVDPRTGKTVYQAGSALLDDQTIAQMANQYRAGDTSVMQNLGRGAQGAENIVRLRREIARQNSAEGTTGTDQAMRNAEFFGVKAGQRTLGTKQANIEMAATEFKNVLPIVREASLTVNRTNYPDFNKIIQAGEEHTGDPKIVAFGSGVNTLVNLYARAISPTGVPTVSDKDHARDILNKAWSQGQFDAATTMMEREIDAALNSPQKVREEMRERFGGSSSAKSEEKAPKGEPAKISTKAEFDALPSGSEFIAPDGSHRRKP